MAYFSNGTEGMALDEQCCKCIHGVTEDGELLPCSVLFLQLNWNYEQENEVKREALDTLIPRDTAECTMFYALKAERK